MVRWPVIRDIDLITQLSRREIIGRYRGSVLGIVWSLLTPLFMIVVFTFVFGTVFQSRWVGGGQGISTAEFAIILFAGILIFQLFAEVITRAPGLVLGNANFVKKVVFPIEILVPVALASALFHAAVGVFVLLCFILAIHGAIPFTAVWLPIVLAPFCVLLLGFGWFLASLGVYYRDISQFVGTVVTALMFLSPIFYPASALPQWLGPWLVLNPIAWPVEEARNVLIFGRAPNFPDLAVYTFVALIVSMSGYQWFQKTRNGFADVL